MPFSNAVSSVARDALFRFTGSARNAAAAARILLKVIRVTAAYH